MTGFNNLHGVDKIPAPTQHFYKHNGHTGFVKNGQHSLLPTATATSSSILPPPVHQSKPVSSPTSPPLPHVHTGLAPKSPAAPLTPLGLPPMDIRARQSGSVLSNFPSISAINRSPLEKGVVRLPPASRANPVQARVPIINPFPTRPTFGAFSQTPLQAHHGTPALSPPLPVNLGPVHALPTLVPGVPRRRPQRLFNAPHAPRSMTVPVAPRPTPPRPSHRSQPRTLAHQSRFLEDFDEYLGLGERPSPSYFKLQAKRLRANHAEPKVPPPTLCAEGVGHPVLRLELFRDSESRLGGDSPRRLPPRRDPTRPIILRGDWQPSSEFLATLGSSSAPASQPQRTPLPPHLRFRSRISGQVVVLPLGIPCEPVLDLQQGLWERVPPTPAEIGMIHRRAQQDMWGGV